MRVMYERCCGLDIHKASITVCALITEKGKTQEETRRFGTMTADLRELAGWLQQKGIRHVAMESTGVYWKPVWNILEPAGFELLLANAQEVKVGARILLAGPGAPFPDRSCGCRLRQNEAGGAEWIWRSGLFILVRKAQGVGNFLPLLVYNAQW